MMMQFIKKQWKWLQKKIKPMPSTEMKKGALPSLPQSSHPDIRSSASLHRSCKTLSLSAFIAAYCNDDLSGLIISGNPASSQLKEAWEDIKTEYASSIKSENSSEIIELARQIGLLQAHCIYVENAILHLRYKYDQDIVNELIIMGYDGNYDPSDVDAYIRQLNRVVSLSKTKVFDLEQLIDQYNSLKKVSSGKKQTEEEYLGLVYMLSRYQKYPIDRKTTMVDEFICIYNNYITEMMWRKKQLEANGKRSN